MNTIKKETFKVVLDYEMETASGKHRIELPFVVGVLADLAGTQDGRLEHLRDRKIQPVDRKNFNDYMRWLGPRLSFTVEDRIEGAGEMPIELTFGSLADFSPENIVEQVPGLKELLGHRSQAIDSFTRGDSPASRVNELDATLSDQLSAVLQHPDFQRLEGSWRGLHFLVSQTPPSARIKFRVMSLSMEELTKEASKYQGHAWDQSGLFHRLYVEEYGQSGGEPFACYVADFQFDHSPVNVTTLRFLAHIGAASDAPFIAGLAPSHFHLQHWAELGSPIDFNYQAPEFDAWRDLRQSPEARFIGLVAPRFLARPPYGTGPNRTPTEVFPFQENTEDPCRAYTWSNSASLVVFNIVRAFVNYGWCSHISGGDSGGAIESLDTIAVPSTGGRVQSQCPVEINVDERKETELARLGLMVPLTKWGGGMVVFFGTQTLHQWPEYDNPDATACARLGASLRYWLGVCRFTHYLKCIARDCCNQMESRKDVEDYLNRWLERYVDNSLDYSGAREQAMRPLLGGQVILEPASAGEECYQVKFYCQPNYQLEGLTGPLRHEFLIYNPPARPPLH